MVITSMCLAVWVEVNFLSGQKRPPKFEFVIYSTNFQFGKSSIPVKKKDGGMSISKTSVLSKFKLAALTFKNI